MTKREIERLGFGAGVAAVNCFYGELNQEIDLDGEGPTEAELTQRLRATLAPGHLSWDEGARNANAAASDRIFGAANVERYYAAYNRGAAARIAELVTD